MDCSPPGSSIHGISQARVLGWVAISFSRGSSRPRDPTWVSCITGRCFYCQGSRQGSPGSNQLRWGPIGVGWTPASIWGVSLLKGVKWTQTGNREKAVWSLELYCHKSRNYQELEGRPGRYLSLVEHGPTDTPMLGFQPPELWDNNFLLFQSLGLLGVSFFSFSFLFFFYSSLRKLIQCLRHFSILVVTFRSKFKI